MPGGPQLFSPLEIRGLTLDNRIGFGPMATYSAVAGTVGDWYLTHLSQIAAGGSALVFLEAAAISRQGRVFQGAVGIWQDEQIMGLRRLTDFLHQQGVVVGFQLTCRGDDMLNLRPWDKPEGDVDSYAANLGIWDMDPAMTEAPSGPLAHEYAREDLGELTGIYEQAARRGGRLRRLGDSRRARHHPACLPLAPGQQAWRRIRRRSGSPHRLPDATG